MRTPSPAASWSKRPAAAGASESNGEPALGDQGTDYTESGRISARTGRPTIIGWYFHEVQWRGDTPGVTSVLQERQSAVDEMYLAGNDSAKVLEILEPVWRQLRRGWASRTVEVSSADPAAVRQLS